MKNLLLLIFVFTLFCSCSKKDNNNDVDITNFEKYIEDFNQNEIISNSILDELDKVQLRILRNTIYAKHGYFFNSDNLYDYFSQFAWYKGLKTNVEHELTDIDLQNIRNIINYENNFASKKITTIDVDSSIIENQSDNLFTDLNSVAEYLETANSTMEKPIMLKLKISLGSMSDVESNWQRLLKILDDNGKYVSLDLSFCSVAGDDFNPIASVKTGKWFIVSLATPDIAINIPSGNSRGSTFTYFNNLKSLYGKEIVTIGLNAFNDCNNLSINFPSVTSIEENNFSNSVGISKVNFPEATIVNKNAFKGCANLVTLNFPKANKIDEGAFQGCTSLSSVSFPAVLTIGINAFQGCTNLSSASFLIATTIDRNGFQGCTGLSEISFPQVTNIGQTAFQNCTNLTNIFFPLVTTLGFNSYTTVGIFQNCISLVSVDFPVATTIGWNVFQGCTSLSKLNFPLVSSIGENTFQGCTSLTDIYFPKLRSTGELSFSYCTALKSVNFPEIYNFGVDHFYGGSSTFEGCNNLISFTIGEHYNIENSLIKALPGNLHYSYRSSGAGTYIRSVGSNNWTKQ